jgi:hypothetical protein
VTITRDRSAFDNAKAAFFAAHPQFSEGSLVNNTARHDSGSIISVYQPPSVQLPAELALAAALAVVDTTVATQVEVALNPNEGEDVNVSVEFADDEIPDAPAVQVDDGLLDLLAVGECERDSDDILLDGLDCTEL